MPKNLSKIVLPVNIVLTIFIDLLNLAIYLFICSPFPLDNHLFQSCSIDQNILYMSIGEQHQCNLQEQKNNKQNQSDYCVNIQYFFTTTHLPYLPYQKDDHHRQTYRQGEEQVD